MKKNNDIVKQLAPVNHKNQGSQSTNNTDTPLQSQPKKQASKKKRIVLQMSLFGKIWTALDRMSTSNTRQYFKSISGQFKEGSEQVTWRRPITDENMLTRIQIFSEKIIEWLVTVISSTLKTFFETNL
jgi:hypothetical protein